MGSLGVEEISNSNSVISLQEFVKNKPITSIPKHYFRQDLEYHQTPPSNGDVLPITTPTIDMARLVSGEDNHHHLELDKLHSTCKDWGVFQLVNHGVKSSVVEKLKNELEEFYNLPMEERMKYKIKPGEHEGYGNIGREDGKRDWADSIEHKATANMVKERMTVAFFVNPKFEAEVGPSPSLINPKNPPLFKRVGMEQYVRDYFVRRPYGKTYLQHMRIENGEDNVNKTSYIEN
ncbi:hypothetical protein COLO4_22811 [Corchorus olitorius]|uniref:Non-haem dioxygenase N-terminal domain-containing protein n=1 Tax=Corchorus olitorius TaxID=93759 RepID=A0A1R3IJP2_9ROSI|nr:hypothetical protein COLO4_22811 [Corchorus olitorius]